jgi:hypothetical protein
LYDQGNGPERRIFIATAGIGEEKPVMDMDQQDRAEQVARHQDGGDADIHTKNEGEAADDFGRGMPIWRHAGTAWGLRVWRIILRRRMGWFCFVNAMCGGSFGWRSIAIRSIRRGSRRLLKLWRRGCGCGRRRWGEFDFR